MEGFGESLSSVGRGPTSLLPKTVDTTLSTVTVGFFANTELILAHQAHAGTGPKRVTNLTILPVLVTLSRAPVQLLARGVLADYFTVNFRLFRSDVLIE